MDNKTDLNKSNEYFEKLKDYFITSLLDRDRKKAEILIADAVKDGAALNDIYIKVFQESQYTVGKLWQTGKISVAQEHFCTAATQSVMSSLYQYIFQTDKLGKNFLSFCVSDELHDLGIKIVTDLVEIAGFDTVYLGANVPTKQIEEAIVEYKADVVGISVSIASHLNTLTDLIKTIRSSKYSSGVKIIIGGYCLNTLNNLWVKIGADAFARDGDDAIIKIKQLVSSSQ